MRNVVRVLGLSLVLLIVVGAAAFYGLYFLNTPQVRGVPQEVSFRVDSGESLTGVATRLHEEGLLRRPEILRIVSRLRGTDGRLQSGRYLLSNDLSAVQIHEILTTGRQVLQRVTIPEGWTIRRIAARLEEHGILAASDFIAVVNDEDFAASLGITANSLEGYLYPDTYYFVEDFPAERVAAHMVERFLGVLEDIYPEYETLSPEFIHERVVLASIIEREYISPDEAPLMASVFQNRLDANMRLESCATVVYVMTEEEGLAHPSRLFYRDLERASPYNTYRNVGLPPGPISNPGQTALNAAFHPAESDYWFFVLRGPGADRHHFSRSLYEHSEAAVLYLRGTR
ncbi:MAG: endolytic transglycosylase MltG [Spirochaetaceae bacterium]|nr:MAG: endolytic transglycosylase MltG [Spirochaetaceae bacterium]